MKNYIKISDEKNGKIDFYWENGIHLGHAFRDETGLFVFEFAHQKYGCWYDYALKEISDKLFKLNKSWRKQLNKYVH